MSRFAISKFALLVLLMAWISMDGWAEAARATECGADRKAAAHGLDEITWKQLNQAYEDAGEEKFEDAFAALIHLLERAGRDEYLQAILAQALAQVEWSRGNYDSALAYFERAVELDVLPDPSHFALMYQIAQLYYRQERYEEALKRLELWFCHSPPGETTPTAWVLKASIQFQQTDYAGALRSIENAIEMDASPQEQWFQLKLACQYELEQYPQSAETLEAIISRWPQNRRYWVQLSQIYLNLKQDQKALAVLALAYRLDLLGEEADIVFLANLYGNANVPSRAAQVLEKGIEDGMVSPSQDHWSAVADFWFASEELEKSLSAYELAGQASVDGGVDLRRGYILLDLERWQDASSALDLALQKGGLDDLQTGRAYLLRGIARFNLGNFDDAGADWSQASRYDRSRDEARQWINHLREERRRKAS